MKKLFFLAIFVSQMALADECKVVTVTTEHDGRVDTETATVCKEGQGHSHKIKIGDTILESEVGVNKRVSQYFTYKNSKCRLFTENTVINKELRINNGVICQLDNTEANWLVVDKW
jgi:hypothetical protein